MTTPTTSAAPSGTVRADVVPHDLRLKCGCTITTGQLPVNGPDEQTRKRAKASLICVIEEHMKTCRDNAGAVPRRGSDVGTSPLLGQKSEEA